MKALIKDGANLESVDWWERTPWLVAIMTGDVEKARYLAECGADLTVTGKGDASPLDLAIESFHTPMIKWLIELRISVESSPDCCNTPLMNAVEAGNTEAVDLLIAAGADIDRNTRCGTALGKVRSSDIALRLLDAGSDPANLSFEGRRAILGLEPEPDEMLFEATLEDFHAAPTARWGDHNPERMDQPFWQAMIRSGVTASAAAQLVGGICGTGPVWCAQRFGQSLTLLPDGRAIQIGGEHEDHYDPDFCIYNEIFVHHPDGRIDIYCYPEDIFGPTDFHAAALIDDSIYVIGGLGYPGSRRFGETPVYRVDTDTLQIFRVECTGEPPGWISEHRAVLASPHEVRVWGGRISAEAGDTESYEKNHCTFILDVSRCQWHREPWVVQS
jgi:ankyrin repeat protein